MSENCVASEKVNDPILYLNSQSLGASGCFCKKYPCMASSQQIYSKNNSKIVEANCENKFYSNVDKAKICKNVLVCSDASKKPEWYTVSHIGDLCNMLNTRYVTKFLPGNVLNPNNQSFTKTILATSTTTAAPLKSVSIAKCKQYNNITSVPTIGIPQILLKINNYKNNGTIQNCIATSIVKPNTTAISEEDIGGLVLLISLILGLGMGFFILAIVCFCCFLNCLKDIFCCCCCPS